MSLLLRVSSFVKIFDGDGFTEQNVIIRANRIIFKTGIVRYVTPPGNSVVVGNRWLRLLRKKAKAHIVLQNPPTCCENNSTQRTICVGESQCGGDILLVLARLIAAPFGSFKRL